MKNPIGAVSLYKVQDGDKHELIAIGYSRSGIARAFHGYGDRSLATAGGGGYDKVSTALDGALEKLTGKHTGVNGAAGKRAVIEAWAAIGVRVVDVLEQAHSL